MRRSVLSVSVIALFCSCSSFPSYSNKIAVAWPPGYAVVPPCRSVITYGGQNFEIYGVKIPIPATGGGRDIGGIEIDPTTLSAVYHVAQTLDESYCQNCKLLPSFAAAAEREMFENAVQSMQNSQAKLQQLAMCVSPGNSATKIALASWVASYSRNGKAAIVKTPAKPNAALGSTP